MCNPWFISNHAFGSALSKVDMTANGMICKDGDRAICLDPRRTGDGVNFVSHAHADHLPSGRAGTVLASFETQQIASLRGVRMDRRVDQMDGVELIDCGHILGSRGLLAGDVFYTGDICTRDRGFLTGARVPRCKILITECTFGLPEFRFPAVAETVSRVNGIVSELYSRGVPVVLMGHQLGKAQILSALFGHWKPLFYHDSVKRMNDLHRELGVDLADAPGHTEAESQGLLDRRPWVMVAPMMPAKSEFVRHIKAKYGAVTVGFSGWAQSARAPFGRHCDHSIPFSDHCDFGELVEMTMRTGAEKVYTIHGYTEEFASHLKRLGIDAQPLRQNTPA